MKGLGADEAYWTALNKGIVTMQRCTGCGTWHWPAVWRCGDCGSWEHAWVEVEPRGRVFAWTRNWHDFGWPAPEGLPYVPVVVELNAAGNKRLLGVMDAPHAEMHIGLPVQGRVAQLQWNGESLPMLRWTIEPATAQEPVAS